MTANKVRRECARGLRRRPGTASWMLIMLSRVPFGAESDHRAQSARGRQPARGPADMLGNSTVRMAASTASRTGRSVPGKC